MPQDIYCGGVFPAKQPDLEAKANASHCLTTLAEWRQTAVMFHGVYSSDIDSTCRSPSCSQGEKCLCCRRRVRRRIGQHFHSICISSRSQQIFHPINAMTTWRGNATEGHCRAFLRFHRLLRYVFFRSRRRASRSRCVMSQMGWHRWLQRGSNLSWHYYVIKRLACCSLLQQFVASSAQCLPPSIKGWG